MPKIREPLQESIQGSAIFESLHKRGALEAQLLANLNGSPSAHPNYLTTEVLKDLWRYVQKDAQEPSRFFLSQVSYPQSEPSPTGQEHREILTDAPLSPKETWAACVTLLCSLVSAFYGQAAAQELFLTLKTPPAQPTWEGFQERLESLEEEKQKALLPLLAGFHQDLNLLCYFYVKKLFSKISGDFAEQGYVLKATHHSHRIHAAITERSFSSELHLTHQNTFGIGLRADCPEEFQPSVCIHPTIQLQFDGKVWSPLTLDFSIESQDSSLPSLELAEKVQNLFENHRHMLKSLIGLHS